jgi:hypothetical protein
MKHDPAATDFRVPSHSGIANVTLGADIARVTRDGVAFMRLVPADTGLQAKARRLLDMVKLRDRHFRRAVMADGAMGVMLSLFLAELGGVPVTVHCLTLTNLLDDEEGDSVIQNLIYAGLIVVTEEASERRTVGLTALGSARMRGFISDYPDI